MDEHCTENVINMMTNEFPTSAAKKTYAQCVFLKKEQDDYGISDVYGKMLQNPEFCAILEELVDFGISRYKVNYSYHYQDTNLVLYQKYTYEDACRLLNWERNEVPLNIGGYKYDKKTKTFPIFINYDKQDNISDTTKYEDHFVAENRLIAISKSGRSMDSEDVQNFLNATERGIDVQLFVRKNKDDKISKEFYYLSKEDRIDLFKHEYAHYMQYNMQIPEKYKWQAGTHGSAWKYCCSLIGAAPTPYYKAGEALMNHDYDKVLKNRIHDKSVPVRDTYQQLKTAQKKKDEVVQYKLGDAVTHPKFGHGIVEKINQRSGGVHLHIRFDGEVKCIDQKWLSRKKYT